MLPSAKATTRNCSQSFFQKNKKKSHISDLFQPNPFFRIQFNRVYVPLTSAFDMTYSYDDGYLVMVF